MTEIGSKSQQGQFPKQLFIIMLSAGVATDTVTRVGWQNCGTDS